jgi:hypothetical protein
VHRVVGAPAGARLTHTGWATGPREPLVSALHGLYGWSPEPETVRAPQGTAYVPWAEMPRLTGETAGPDGADGTSLHVCLAALTGEPGPGPLPEAVTRVLADATGVEVVWADDGAHTRVSFDPVRATTVRAGLGR